MPRIAILALAALLVAFTVACRDNQPPPKAEAPAPVAPAAPAANETRHGMEPGVTNLLLLDESANGTVPGNGTNAQ